MLTHDDRPFPQKKKLKLTFMTNKTYHQNLCVAGAGLEPTTSGV